MPATVEPAVEMPYPTHAPAWAERFGEDDFGIFAGFRVGEVGFLFRWIPPGRFSMGSPKTEEGRWDYEGPVHEVVITRGFWMGETPVTQDQWRAVVETMGRDTAMNVLDPKPGHFTGPGTLPVEQVSWEECVSFCGLLSVGMATAAGNSPSFRLPTEAEWEYASWAGTATRSSLGAGEEALEQHAWSGRNSEARTQPVGMKRENPWGLRDMQGEILEWCSEWVEASGSGRVLRDGWWFESARDCRIAFGVVSSLGITAIHLGFRLVLAPRSVL